MAWINNATSNKCKFLLHRPLLLWQMCRYVGRMQKILWRSGCLRQIQTLLAFPEVSESSPIGVSIPKTPKALHRAPARQRLSILTKHARKTRVFPGKSVWNVFHKLYLCVGCCGMHKILLSQQCEVVEEVSAGRGGRKGHGMHNIWAADSCMHVRARGSLRNWSGSCWLLKCNEAPLKGAPVTGKQGSNGKKCTVIKGEEERRPCFRVAFSIWGAFHTDWGTLNTTHT